jgi:hypothetical protein
MTKYTLAVVTMMWVRNDRESIDFDEVARQLGTIFFICNKSTISSQCKVESGETETFPFSLLVNWNKWARRALKFSANFFLSPFVLLLHYNLITVMMERRAKWNEIETRAAEISRIPLCIIFLLCSRGRCEAWKFHALELAFTGRHKSLIAFVFCLI